MSNIPEDLQYTTDHEWIKIEEGIAVIGITDHAQEALGDITFVDLPDVGTEFGSGDTFGVVESVKAASDIYLPIAGTIEEVNSDLEDSPETLNSDPYGEGWLVRVRISEDVGTASLMDAKSYGEHCENE